MWLLLTVFIFRNICTTEWAAFRVRNVLLKAQCSKRSCQKQTLRQLAQKAIDPEANLLNLDYRRAKEASQLTLGII